MKRFVLFILLYFLLTKGFSQEPAVQQIIEDMIEAQDAESIGDDFQEILDDLEFFRQNPLKVNLEAKEVFLKLHLLSEIQIDKLLDYRARTGTIFSIYELASVDGFSAELLQKLEPFLSFDAPGTLSKKQTSSGDLILRGTRVFKSSLSTTERKYEGSQERFYLRMRQSMGVMAYGFVAEKDPGEAFLRGSNRHGFDYLAGFFNVRSVNNKYQLYAGDYHIRFGQGLVAWQGFSMGKTSEVCQTFRSNEGIRSYASTDENQFMRGISARLAFRNLVVYPFLSVHRLDANVDTLENQNYFGAFQTSGYHRYGSEISGENAVRQFVTGVHATTTYRTWSFGLTSVYNRFKYPILRDDKPYNQFLPEGTEHWASGLNWKGTMKNVFLFGELALSNQSGFALISGANFKPVANTELSLVYRNIGKRYFSYWAGAFTESSKANDEQAIYLGAKLYPASGWSIATYADLFRFRWIKYLTAAPSSGSEWMVQLNWSPSRRTSAYLKLFQEEKGAKESFGHSNYNIAQKVGRIRLNFVHSPGERIQLKSRIEMMRFLKQSTEYGFLVSQFVGVNSSENDWSVNGQVAFFSTESYSSRIYAYEDDILYSFSIPALYGKGFRLGTNFQHRITRGLDIWLKAAMTKQFSGGEDNDTSEASVKPEIKVQIRYRF